MDRVIENKFTKSSNNSLCEKKKNSCICIQQTFINVKYFIFQFKYVIKFIQLIHGVGFRAPRTLDRFELWGACGDLNLPSLPTHDPPKPSATSSKRQRDTTVYPGSGHLAV